MPPKTPQKWTRLYLHPTRLPEILTFCNSTNSFAVESRKFIEELVILGISDAAMQQREERGNSDYVTHIGYPWPADAGTVGLNAAHAAGVQSSSNAGSSSSAGSSNQQTPANTRSWTKHYRSLLWALQQRLPRLTRLSYLDNADEEGWFPVSRATIFTHAQTNRLVVEPVGFQTSRDLVDLTKRCHEVMEWADTEVLYGILVYAGLKFKSVNIGQPFPRGQGVRFKTLDPAIDVRPRELWKNFVTMETVQHMTLTGPGQCYADWNMMLRGTKGLRSLTIDVKSPNDKAWQARLAGKHKSTVVPDWGIEGMSFELQNNLLRNGPADGIFPELEQLNIRGYSQTPDCFRACCVREILGAYKGKLKHVRFRNVLLVDKSNVAEDMKSVVLALRDCNLQSAEFSVPCLSLDPHDLHAGIPKDVKLAQRYKDNCRTWFGREVLDELAADLGVREWNGQWDFSKNRIPIKNRAPAENGAAVLEGKKKLGKRPSLD